MDRKRRHHYVWQYYLRAWAVDARIACMRPGGIFTTATSNVAVQKDFYKLNELTASDLAFIKALCIDPAPAAIQPTLRAWLPPFTALFQLRDVLQAQGLSIDTPQATALFEAVQNNLEEDLHMSIEGMAIPFLGAARDGDLSFLDEEDNENGFLHFLMVQYVRTATMKNQVLLALQGAPGVNVDRILGLTSHIIATTIAYGVVVRRSQVLYTLLEAPEGSEFLTTDQPVVNLHAVDRPSGGGEVEKLEMCYPLSPRLALTLDMEKGRRGREGRRLTASEVDGMNRKLLAHPHEQAFATNEELLRRYMMTA